MSEKPEQTNSPSAASPSAAQTSSLDQVVQKIQPIAQKAWVSSRPTIAQALKATSNTLQSAADRLDQQIAADDTTIEPLNLEPLKRAATTFWEKTQPIWEKLIGLIRTRLPEDISGKLNDRALSGIVAGFALLLLSITTHLPSGNAAPKPQPTAAKPANRPVPVKQPTAQPPTASKPITQKFPVDTAQGGQSFPTDLSAPSLQPATPPAVVTAPATVKPAPTAQPSAPVAPVTTTPKPAPVKLTPEQKLMAKLQADLGEQEDLLAGVKPNKAESSLQISLEPDWYKLPYNQQDRLAQALFDKAQTLRFNSLELLDAKGEVVARSPVVGSEMVILLRQ